MEQSWYLLGKKLLLKAVSYAFNDEIAAGIKAAFILKWVEQYLIIFTVYCSSTITAVSCPGLITGTEIG